ncbi:MAG TPA: hybrid sensor histidine kinase/response regulator [Allocoleopsis sp.]
MTINPDIRDQAYQFFIEEAPELLQAIEAGLLTLRQERNTAKVHGIMRAAHSLKGGAASVELDAIKTIAHRLETIFKALYNETIDIDTDLESQLLQAYDCLRLPLLEQIETGNIDVEQALAIAEPIFAQIEQRLGDALLDADRYIPSSSELGIDMAVSIFEVDVAEGLERLSQVVANPQECEVAGELRAQAEVFAGFADLLNQPGFGAIAHTTLAALDAHPERALVIAQLALSDFQLARQAILAGKNSNPLAIAPSAALSALAQVRATLVPESTDAIAQPIAEIPSGIEVQEETILWLEDSSTTSQENPTVAEVSDAPELTFATQDENLPISSSPRLPVSPCQSQPAIDDYTLIEGDLGADATLEEIFAHAPESLDDSLTAAEGLEEAQNDLPVSPTLAEVEAEHPHTIETTSRRLPLCEPLSGDAPELEPPENLEVAVQSIDRVFEQLPPLQEMPAPAAGFKAEIATAQTPPAPSLVSVPSVNELSPVNPAEALTNPPVTELNPVSADIRQGKASPTPTLSVRVDSERLERMNNVVGELAINRNGLSLQNEQLQAAVRELLSRFVKVQNLVGNLQELSDRMLVDRLSHKHNPLGSDRRNLEEQVVTEALRDASIIRTDFDSLELDSYGTLHLRLQALLEDMVPLEEAVDDIVLFAKATDKTLEQQRQMLTLLRDELMWARMVPLGEVLNRFPRVLRDLSATYHKPVSLKLNGVGVLVDKAALEKLYDPLLHLLRNAFDHGIESPTQRRQQGKPEQGQIEIRAYHQGSQTIIEVRDDGQGLNTERIRTRAVELGLLPAEQVATLSNNRLFELLFEPGFSTVTQVSELSGRGVGLDIVRAQMRSLKGTIAITSSPGHGTAFTLRLPLTLTISKLLVCIVGVTALAIPSDSVEEIVIPKADRVKSTGSQRFLRWRGQVVPAYRVSDLLEYNCPMPEAAPSKALVAVPSPQDWALPMLILRQEQYVLALEIDRLVTEQELVIKPFGEAIAPPSCTYGCTILGDGSLIPVIDGAVLLDQVLGRTKASITTGTGLSLPSGDTPIELSLPATNENSSVIKTTPTIRIAQAPTVLIVDDAVALRRTLALTLERGGCRVLQARDGREAIEQLHQSSAVKLVVCDIEMPNMNGFEFLQARRQDPVLSKIPVVMLTSRSNDKHRWLAMRLGANAYFTKPYLEQDFLAAIKDILTTTQAENSPVLQAGESTPVLQPSI